ncbi:hypothetical protein NE237_001375 [Protea cynaroides]|uniref:Uncharacterized protein n=1 Tax=Protea cynaroides TaxID=273540 RepID=A0A9Q0KU18_9MAGN|nr:hypothetical protein NE237_001375 [Protea cynaroides]
MLVTYISHNPEFAQAIFNFLPRFSKFHISVEDVVLSPTIFIATATTSTWHFSSFPKFYYIYGIENEAQEVSLLQPSVQLHSAKRARSSLSSSDDQDHTGLTKAMAPVNSSSRRKSSSSQKKKRSKPSSEAVRKRRSRSRRRNKSKKLRRRDASISYSEDDSRTENSISVSSSDSEDDYRSRRARSRTRGEAKGSRKKGRRSSLSRDTEGDPPNRKKRRGSKRIRGSKERRNSHRRNRGKLNSRRDANASPTSSGSWSCSTCRGGSSDYERSKGRSEERDKSKTIDCDRLRGRSKERNKSKSNGRYEGRHRFRSSSSCSTCDDRGSYQNEDRYAGEKYSGRLRSVLAVVKQSKEKEGNRNSRDDDRTEIIQAYDDCPSCRSNDSYDGGRKRESSYHPHGPSEKKRRLDDAKSEDNSKIKTEIIGIGKENDGAKYDGNDQNLSRVGPSKTSTESRSELPSAIDSSEGDDLELKLRQKALENLRKFRGGLHTNKKPLQKDDNGGDGNLPSTAKVETVQNEPQNEDRSQLLGATQIVTQIVTPAMERIYTPTDGLIPDQRHESAARLDNAHSIKGDGNMVLNQTAVTGKLTEKNKPNVGINGNTMRESSVDQSNLKEAPTSKEFPKEKLMEARNISNKNVLNNLKTLGSSNTHGAASNESRLAATEACSIPTTAATEHCRSEQKDEAKGSSHFEQKTMSVMRGGEMVQVSYKVYIPKKAPALARRHLQR